MLNEILQHMKTTIPNDYCHMEINSEYISYENSSISLDIFRVSKHTCGIKYTINDDHFYLYYDNSGIDVIVKYIITAIGYYY